jgi:hypothetical protein
MHSDTFMQKVKGTQTSARRWTPSSHPCPSAPTRSHHKKDPCSIYHVKFVSNATVCNKNCFGSRWLKSLSGHDPGHHQVLVTELGFASHKDEKCRRLDVVLRSGIEPNNLFVALSRDTKAQVRFLVLY